jgi:ribosomal subunit interface protein
MAMRVELTGHQVDISPGLRGLVDRKLAKVMRVVNDAAVSAGVVVKKERVHNVVEITLHARGERFVHAVAKADSWQAAMTAAVAKVLHQAEKFKGVWQERKRRGEAARSVKTPRRARRAAARKTSPVTAPAAAGPATDLAADRPRAGRTRKQR